MASNLPLPFTETSFSFKTCHAERRPFVPLLVLAGHSALPAWPGLGALEQSSLEQSLPSASSWLPVTLSRPQFKHPLLGGVSLIPQCKGSMPPPAPSNPVASIPAPWFILFRKRSLSPHILSVRLSVIHLSLCSLLRPAHGKPLAVIFQF